MGVPRSGLAGYAMRPVKIALQMTLGRIGQQGILMRPRLKLDGRQWQSY